VAGTFLFNNGNAGHLCDMGVAPAVGETTVLCINSDTVVTAVTSSAGAAWVLAESSVAAQGSYIYYRKATGGEPSTFTVTTTGNFNTHVGWSGWPSLNALDTSTNTQASSANVITPIHSTGVMAENTELVIAFGALHAIGIADQNTPIWSTGFTELTSSAAQGTGGSGVRGYVGYKQNAGTAAEAPRVQWSGDNVTDRYMLTVSFTTIGANVNVPASNAAGTGTASNPKMAVSPSVGVDLGTGVANPASILISPSVGVSAGSGAALDASTTIATSGVGTAAGIGAAPNPSISIEMGGDVHLYKFGPCEPWDPIWTCNISLITGAAEVTGVAVQAASEILYQLSAQRFGLCSVQLRPCRKSCQSSFPWYSWWQYGTYPQPYWWNGTWYNLACNSCPENSCSCIGLAETELPGPVHSIVEVKLNGEVLVEGVDYRVDDYRKLVRLGGDQWPYCQDMRLADTEDNTWSVTAEYGEVVPTIGRMAVGELALEFVKYLLCDDNCQFPYGVVDISRQGVSMSIQSIADLIKTGMLNLRMCDMFIMATNPQHMTARAAVYDLDAPTYRAVGTT